MIFLYHNHIIFSETQKNAESAQKAPEKKQNRILLRFFSAQVVKTRESHLIILRLSKTEKILSLSRQMQSVNNSNIIKPFSFDQNLYLRSFLMSRFSVRHLLPFLNRFSLPTKKTGLPARIVSCQETYLTLPLPRSSSSSISISLS